MATADSASDSTIVSAEGSNAQNTGKAVHLLGEIDSVYYAIADRLIRAGASLTDSREAAEITVAIGTAAANSADPAADIAVIPPDSLPPDSKIIVRVHDLLVPEGLTGWGSEVIHEWVEWVKEGAEGLAPADLEERHWVHIRDASDAISLIILADADAISQGVIDLAGRRAWSAEAVLDEMGLLWGRYTDALNLSHSIESLSSIPSPAAAQFKRRVTRPNLTPLHDALKSAGHDEGWHPLTAMRLGIMELFAHAQMKEDA